MQWQYWDNPYGPADSLAWVENGVVVCHCASLPVPIRTKRHARLGVISVDAATAPTHRGRHLYQQLLEESVRAGRERELGICLYFETIEGPAKLWDVAKVRLEPFILPLDLKWLAQRIRLPRHLSTALRVVVRTPPAGDACEVADVPEGLDDLWSATHAAGEWTVVKDEAWWRWRFGAHPYGVYRFFELRDGDTLRGAAVTRPRQLGDRPVEYLVELLARDDAAARALVGLIGQSTPEAVAIVARATSASPLVRWIRTAGFRRVPDRFEPKHPWVTWWPALVEFAASESIPWAITLGDSDSI